MNEIKRTHIKHKNSVAAYLLYAASGLGILGIIFVGHFTRILSIDIVVYAILLVLAILIHTGANYAKVLYGILATIWYIALIFILPERFGHSLDIYIIFMQLLLTFYATFILYIRSKESV